MCDPLRFRVERGLAVHDEAVVVVAVVELYGEKPRAAGPAVHRVRGGIPIVEIAGEENFLRIRRDANKVHRLGDFLGRVTVGGDWKGDVMTMG